MEIQSCTSNQGSKIIAVWAKFRFVTSRDVASWDLLLNLEEPNSIYTLGIFGRLEILSRAKSLTLSEGTLDWAKCYIILDGNR